MLQQTRVPRVLLKYPLFLHRFPTPRTLARSPLREVLKAWQGMGYNRRALHLKRLAEILVREHAGKVPSDAEALRRLPGIGSNTAGAIRAFAFNKPSIFIETNIRRVFLHHFFPRRVHIPDARIMELVRRTLPRSDFRGWYSALMDYGALALQKKSNPNRRSAHYARQTPFQGSPRQIRGKIVAALIENDSASPRELRTRVSALLGRTFPARDFSVILQRMTKDGVIAIRNGRVIFTS